MPRTLIKIEGTVLELLDGGFLVEPGEPQILASETHPVSVSLEDVLPGLDSLGDALSRLDEVDVDDLGDLVDQLVACKLKTERREIAVRVDDWIKRLQAARESLDRRFKALTQDANYVKVNVETEVLP